MTEGARLASGELLMAVEPEDVTAGGVGFLVIAGLVVGTVFLLRSMNKQLKKVDFEEQPDDGDGSAPADDTEEPESGDQPEEGPRTSQP